MVSHENKEGGRTQIRFAVSVLLVLKQVLESVFLEVLAGGNQSDADGAEDDAEHLRIRELDKLSADRC